MKSAALGGVVVGSIAVAALLSPAVTAGLASLLHWHVPLARVFDRVFEILLIVALVVWWRRLDLGSAADIGLRHPSWPRDLGRGLCIGLGGVAMGLLLGWAAGAVVPQLRFAPGKTVWKVALGLLGAVIVGVGEEALFRGVLLRRFRLDFGPRAAVIVSTAIYAVVHALRTRGSSGLAGPWGGVHRVMGLFAPLGEPATWPSLVGLTLLGLLLVAARQRSGALWVSIGIHASWVAVFRVGRLFMHVRPRPVWVVGPGWPPLIGGIAGLVALAGSAFLLWRMSQSFRRHSPP